MKAKVVKRLAYIFILGLIVSACEERIELDYQRYEQVILKGNDGSLIYQDVISYPLKDTIFSEAPSFEVSGVYGFAMDTILASGGSTYVPISFGIDKLTGVVYYNNQFGSLSDGVYDISIRMFNSNGIAVHDKAVRFSILPVPVTLNVDNAVVEAGVFEEGVVATVSAMDSSAENLINTITYSLQEAPLGFSIDASTGAITKNTDAITGENKISVIATTNLGSKLFVDLLNVKVGLPPTLDLYQQDGETPLTAVTLSPYTAYTSSVPKLTDMEASGGWGIVLPSELSDYASLFSIDTQGSMSIEADANLPVGSHMIGFTATNSGGTSFTFSNKLQLNVEERWMTDNLFDDTFDDSKTGQIIPGNTVYPDYAGYAIGSGSGGWSKAVITKDNLPTIEGIRIVNPGLKDYYLVKTIDISSVKGLRVSFEEAFGYNDAFVGTTYTRGFYIGTNTTDLESGSFDISNWNVVMDNDDVRWPTRSAWATRIPSKVSNVLLDMTQISGDELKLMWFIGGGATSQNGQYIIDSCEAQYTTSFSAEEE
ncbi:MAG: hypothetical protein ACPHXR_00205 [Flavicella sp.]